jgi:hypothetical protein
MPKPPGNGVDKPHPRAPHSPRRRKVPLPEASVLSEHCGLRIYIKDECQEYRICCSDNYFVLFCGSQAPSPCPLPHGERESVIVSVQSCILTNGGIKR